LDIRDLRTNIWKPPMYPEYLHDFMIALLQKFELVYKVPLIVSLIGILDLTTTITPKIAPRS